jgi:EH domain-containing protein 1
MCGVLCVCVDMQSVIQWFADRADLIIIMFDAHKLDISDELRTVMDALRIHQVGRHTYPP